VFVSAPVHAFIAQVRAILDADDSLLDELPDEAPPTLVICGSQDILTPQADSEELAELIPGAELVVIRGASHGFVIEAAPAFNRAVGGFLARVVAERRAVEVEPIPAAAD
jgi:3-oxoadipate enol-lactonase